MESYEIQLEQLKNEEIKEIIVPHNNFLLFRTSWLKREDKKFFVGEASHGGNVTYRYDINVV